jgi:hypothetical protein
MGRVGHLSRRSTALSPTFQHLSFRGAPRRGIWANTGLRGPPTLIPRLASKEPTRTWGTGLSSLRNSLIVREGEIHLDLCLYVNGAVIQDIRMIDPLFDGIDRRRHEHRVTADEFQILNRPIFADIRLQQNRTLDSRLPRKWRIGWLHFLGQETFRHARGH